jgi:ribose 5-phosphate isomerase B
MIYLGADHRGFQLKEKIKQWLDELDYKYEDKGAFEYNKDDDYPDFATAVSTAVALSLPALSQSNGSKGDDSRGILICGSGIGVAIAANKIKGIRAGTAINAKQIHDSVNDEDLNVLAISADYTSEAEAKEIVKIFLETKFSGGKRHIRRVNKIKEIEK